MRYLVDSDWVADYLKGKVQAVDQLILVTRNRQHFERIPNLQLY